MRPDRPRQARARGDFVPHGARRRRRRPIGRSLAVATQGRSPAWLFRSRTCSMSPARQPARLGHPARRPACRRRRARRRRLARAPARRRSAARTCASSPSPASASILTSRMLPTRRRWAATDPPSRGAPTSGGALRSPPAPPGPRSARTPAARSDPAALQGWSASRAGAAGADRRRVPLARRSTRLGDDPLGTRRMLLHESSPAGRSGSGSARRPVAIRGADPAHA